MLNNQMRRTCTRSGAALAGAALLAAPVVAQFDCHYTWEEIRVNGAYPVAWSINNLGHVAGLIDNGGDNTYAFVWTPETGVGVLPFPDGVYSMAAYAINDSGQIAGYMENGIEPLGFVWQAGVGYSIIDPPSPRANMYITDINNHGQVVGSVYRRAAPGPWHWDPFVWESGNLTVLTGLAGTTSLFADAINELGEIAGHSIDSMGLPQSIRITNRSVVTWLPLPPGFSASRVLDMNNRGTIVGYGYYAQPFHFEAIAWSDTGMDVIPPVAGQRDAYFYGINDAGRIVGHYYRGVDDRPFAFQQGTLRELRELLVPQPTSLINISRGINASGQIVVTAGNRSIRLTPHWLEGDLTGDCRVSLDDLALLLVEYGAEPGSYIGADVNNDGQLDLTDLAILLSNFGN